MRIAVCDDCVRDLTQIKAMIEKLGENLELEGSYFSSGEALLAAAEKDKERGFSLAVLDVYMEQADGITTARRLRELFPEIQIAFLTSSADHAVRRSTLTRCIT